MQMFTEIWFVWRNAEQQGNQNRFVWLHMIVYCTIQSINILWHYDSSWTSFNVFTILPLSFQATMYSGQVDGLQKEMERMEEKADIYKKRRWSWSKPYVSSEQNLSICNHSMCVLVQNMSIGLVFFVRSKLIGEGSSRGFSGSRSTIESDGAKTSNIGFFALRKVPKRWEVTIAATSAALASFVSKLLVKQNWNPWFLTLGHVSSRSSLEKTGVAQCMIPRESSRIPQGAFSGLRDRKSFPVSQMQRASMETVHVVAVDLLYGSFRQLGKESASMNVSQCVCVCIKHVQVCVQVRHCTSLFKWSRVVRFPPNEVLFWLCWKFSS